MQWRMSTWLANVCGMWRQWRHCGRESWRKLNGVAAAKIGWRRSAVARNVSRSYAALYRSGSATAAAYGVMAASSRRSRYYCEVFIIQFIDMTTLYYDYSAVLFIIIRYSWWPMYYCYW